MRIGFDAKRLFFNRSGLGNYSRFILENLHLYLPEVEPVLFSPCEASKKGLYSIHQSEELVLPPSPFFRNFSAIWRSFRMGESVAKKNLEIFHGLSAELPLDIKKGNVASVVTMHDLIFLRYPNLYKPIDRYLYTFKYKKSAEIADKVIAISTQTKTDLIDFWGISESKISVIQQGCNPIFRERASPNTLLEIQKKYNLPAEYILSVGTIEERKNVLSIVQAMVLGKVDVPLVLIGRATSYMEKVYQYATKHNIENRIFHLENVPTVDLPPLYQLAKLFIYPSVFEGFGIPILEAMYSQIPIISSNSSCFKETGGLACCYVDPQDPQEIGAAIASVLENTELQKKMVTQGLKKVDRYDPEGLTGQLMELYMECL